MKSDGGEIVKEGQQRKEMVLLGDLQLTPLLFHFRVLLRTESDSCVLWVFFDKSKCLLVLSRWQCQRVFLANSFDSRPNRFRGFLLVAVSRDDSRCFWVERTNSIAADGRSDSITIVNRLHSVTESNSNSSSSSSSSSSLFN